MPSPTDKPTPRFSPADCGEPLQACGFCSTPILTLKRSQAGNRRVCVMLRSIEITRDARGVVWMNGFCLCCGAREGIENGLQYLSQPVA